MGIGVPSKLSEYQIIKVIKEYNCIKKDVLAKYDSKYYILHLSDKNPFKVKEISIEELKHII